MVISSKFLYQSTMQSKVAIKLLKDAYSSK